MTPKPLRNLTAIAFSIFALVALALWSATSRPALSAGGATYVPSRPQDITNVTGMLRRQGNYVTLPVVATRCFTPASATAAISVSAATNAAPIAITTSTTHTFATGDKVIVSGAAGNTAANSTWTITVSDTTHFTLNTSDGTAFSAYSGSGVVYPQSATYRSFHLFPKGATGVRLVYGNFWTQPDGLETHATNSLVVKASIEYDTGVTYPVLWSGSASTITIPANQTAISEPVNGFTIPAGARAYVRTYVQNVGSTDKWPLGVSLAFNSSLGLPASDWRQIGADYTSSGTGTIPSATGIQPCAILGHPLTGDLVSVGIVGDSIAQGTGDASGSPGIDGITTYGFIVRALNNQFGYIQCAESGTSAYEFAHKDTNPSNDQVQNGGRLRSTLIASCDYTICEFGTNDLASRTLAQIQADLISLWTTQAALGQRVVQTTLTPKTTSTDSWATVGNQTPANPASVQNATNATPIVITTAASHFLASGQSVLISGVGGNTAANGTWTVSVTDSTHFSLTSSAGNSAYTSGGKVFSEEANRKDFNSWLRDGAPILNGAAAATGSSAAGTLRAGQSGHPVWKIADSAALVEVNASNTITTNGGFWTTNGSANYPTTDGTHPTATLHITMSGAIPTGQMKPF